jgi:hypothetical protein
MDRFVVHVVNYVMLVHNHHLNIDYNQVDIKHRLIVVNIVHQFVDNVVMLPQNLDSLNKHPLEVMHETMVDVLMVILLQV